MKFTISFRLGERFYVMLSNLAFYFQLDIVPNPKIEQFIYLQIDFEFRKINWRFFKFTNVKVHG
jgi:hypothetical protein